MALPKPRTPAPELEVTAVGGESWKLSAQTPRTFTMVVFYRGLHCPLCKGYLRDLDRKMGDFGSRGVEVIAVSTDGRERAERAAADWGLQNLKVGYGQSLDSARQWGLFISGGIREGEPERFAEPGLFLVKPDGSIYYEAVNSAPYGRPSFGDLLSAVDFVVKNNYPARGEA